MIPPMVSSSYSLGMMSSTGSITQDEFISGSKRKSFVKLNAEISKLRAIKAFTKADAEEKLENQKETMDAMLVELDLKFRKSVEENECVRKEIVERESGIKNDEKSHEDAEQNLKMIEVENEELYEQLNELNNERKRSQEELGYTERQLETIQTSLRDMLDAQESITLASKSSDDMLKKEYDSRMAALYKLLEEEGHRRNKLSELKQVGLNVTVHDTLDKQRTYLRTVCSSLGESSDISKTRLEQYRVNEDTE